MTTAAGRLACRVSLAAVAGLLVLGVTAFGSAAPSSASSVLRGVPGGSASTAPGPSIVAWGPPALHYRVFPAWHAALVGSPNVGSGAAAAVLPSPSASPTPSMVPGLGAGYTPMMHCSHMSQPAAGGGPGTAR